MWETLNSPFPHIYLALRRAGVTSHPEEERETQELGCSNWSYSLFWRIVLYCCPGLMFGMTGHAQAVSPVNTEDIKTRCDIDFGAAQKILLYKGHCLHFSLWVFIDSPYRCFASVCLAKTMAFEKCSQCKQQQQRSRGSDQAESRFGLLSGLVSQKLTLQHCDFQQERKHQ